MDNNLENIKNFHNGLLIKEAESKLLFIAFCFEFNRYLKIFESVKSTLMNPNYNIKYPQKTDGGKILSEITNEEIISRGGTPPFKTFIVSYTNRERMFEKTHSIYYVGKDTK